MFAPDSAQNRFVAKVCRIRHKRVLRFDRVQFERAFILIHCRVWQYHAICCAANGLPFHDLLILRGFILCEHEVVQFHHSIHDTLFATPADVLNRFADLVSDLKTDNFVRYVSNDFVVDLRSHLFHPVQNRLVALVIAPQIFNLTGIQGMYCLCFPKRFQQVGGVYRAIIQHYFSPTEKPSATHVRQ